MVEGPSVLLGFEIPGIPHFRYVDLLAGLSSTLFDIVGPKRTPSLIPGGLVVHAEEYMSILHRM